MDNARVHISAMERRLADAALRTLKVKGLRAILNFTPGPQG
jgi:hypothetical protein